jgi:hypothetical protein
MMKILAGDSENYLSRWTKRMHIICNSIKNDRFEQIPRVPTVEFLNR